MNRFKILTVLMWVVVFALITWSPALAHGGGARTGLDGGPVVEAIRKFGQTVLDILIGIGAVLLTLGIATGFVGGQFLVTVGQPYGLSQAWVRVVAVVICAVGLFLTRQIAQSVLSAVGTVNTDIPMPAGY